ncbi:MAG TPA: 50S ribosomal protein L10 [Eggerthellaceae bacterium]|nr:50S ribosomal protein L10 [Eggerthellaceae bacterium]
MPNARNIEMMENIKADLEGVSAMWVVDACGLTVKEVEALRRSIRETGSIMKVYKNTVMKKALAELELANMDEILEGPSAFVFCAGDVAAAAKAVTEFAKDNSNLEVKGGMMDGAFVTAEEVKAIASLPSKEVLLAQIAGAISGVARGLAVCINGVPSGLARQIQQIADQKAA